MRACCWEKTSMPALRADIVGYGRDKRLVLVGEIKNKKNTSPIWAAQLRRNILAHSDQLPSSEFFLVATPDRLYLWKSAGNNLPPDARPIDIDAKQIFSSYLERAGVAPESASSPAFELAVAAWLAELAQSGELRAKLAAVLPALLDSGFLDAIKDGQIALDEAA
jgi:hypothetical protein